ncbi:MAG: DNA-binding protein [Desulfuromonas sp. SDB]|nr:MAG: DNA-binding protein [Desulfuromonas sp. SDB]
MSKSLSVRIPDKLAKKLDSVAKESERSKSFLIQKALESFLEEQADLQIALDRLHDTTDEIIYLEDMKEELEI